MRAKIQITVNMDDIPEEVRERVERIFYKAEISLSEIKNMMGDISEDNMLSATNRIDKIRKELSFIDSVLEDSYNILVGYTKYKAKQLEDRIPSQEEISQTEDIKNE